MGIVLCMLGVGFINFACFIVKFMSLSLLWFFVFWFWMEPIFRVRFRFVCILSMCLFGLVLFWCMFSNMVIVFLWLDVFSLYSLWAIFRTYCLCTKGWS